MRILLRNSWNRTAFPLNGKAVFSLLRTVMITVICFGFSIQSFATLPRYVVIDKIVVYKSSRKMYVYMDGEWIKTYRIALGSNPEGRKRCSGDCKTPEGIYYIDDKNPNSDYHKNLGISYPNDRDRERARRLGKSPGGDIKIHGLPNGKGYLGRSHRINDWTEGCIAVTNEEIDELFDHVEVGTPIYIYP